MSSQPVRTENPGVADDATIRAAIDAANLNVLRLALYQETRDSDLERMQIRIETTRGRDDGGYILEEQYADEVKAKAFAFLRGRTPEDRKSTRLNSSH